MLYDWADNAPAIVDGVLRGALPNRSSGGHPSDRTASEDQLVRTTVATISEALGRIHQHQKHDEADTAVSTTELAQLIINVHSCNTHLLKLSALAQQGQSRGYRTHPLTDTEVEEGDVTTLIANFPLLNQKKHLASKLGKLVTQRRQWLLSRQKEHGDGKDDKIHAWSLDQGKRLSPLSESRR